MQNSFAWFGSIGQVCAMAKIAPAPLPVGALLASYAEAGAFTDCYATCVDGAVSLERFVAAFYSSPEFRPERVLIGLLMPDRRAGAAEVAAIASGNSTGFSAWTVEARSEDQILLCDFQRRTRSWLMVRPAAGADSTRLYFGSAVVRIGRSAPSRWGEVAAFNGLLWFHKLYSRALLNGAARRLRSPTTSDTQER